MSGAFFIGEDVEMALKPGRPCKAPGCPRLANSQTGYCATHDQQAKRQADTQRPNANQRGYNASWQRRRIPYINQHPLCWYCQQGGRGYFSSPLFNLDKELIPLQLQLNKLQRYGMPAGGIGNRIEELKQQRDAIPNLPEIVTATACIDHFIPHKGNPALFNDEDNWRSSCDGCHAIKTAKEDGAFGNPVHSKALEG
jgi:5-methylcytosine-specific restriction protein A